MKQFIFSEKETFLTCPITLPDPPFISDIMKPIVIKPISKRSSTHWLRVYFDSHFSFKEFAAKMASIGRKAISGLKMLTNTIHSMEPIIMRKVIHTCILPIFTYGMSVWWSGHSRLCQKGTTIGNRIDGHLKQLNKVQNIALRAILPV